ncbi:hypothetical protein [Haliangium sp. UPWRP_2]|uniref:hypothetical protein n=1 Tax=Haliangium sp. UPWRP_2 TaxID=1931276 RepID=UPI0011B21204|nr:hypothetical protein [Haliangium sp. UPWRP_2]
MDLFKPLVPTDAQHPNFKRFLEYYSQETRDELQRWADGFVDRDGKFVKEFQTTFNSSFWELYLHIAFKTLGFTLDFSHQSPDFLVRTPNGPFIAEAVIASHPDGYAPEWEWSQANDSTEVIRVACIRLANAITSKYKKYCDLYASKSHVKGLPFVICVTPFEQPQSFAQNLSAIRRVAYGYELLMIHNEKTGEPLVVGETKFENTYKDTGADIPLSLFLDPKYACISAILFSTTARMCKLQALCNEQMSADRQTIFCADRFDPSSKVSRRIVASRPEYKETVLDGLHVFLNPHASVPLDVRAFQNQEIALHDYDLARKEYRCYMPDNFLIHRFCHTLIAKESMPDAQTETSSEKQYKQPFVKPWPEDQLHPVDAQVMMFDQNHLAHYRGWTILIAHDIEDNDWSAQAVAGTYTSVPEYIKANRRAGLDESAMLASFCSSKEIAWEKMRLEIDKILDAVKSPD